MRVVVLLGQLERSVAVLINSTEASTATPNLGMYVPYMHYITRMSG